MNALSIDQDFATQTRARILVASHKPYWMPGDPVYLPVQVGAAGKESLFGFQRDDEGENISGKNPNYCELTALYWAWKNLDTDYIGLAHYRRHFAVGHGDKRSRVATGEQMLDALQSVDVVLPKPRKYYIETNYSQYAHAHHEEDLVLTREIIANHESWGISKYDEIMSRTYGHRFNMFAMRKDLADKWCEWLFGVLSELEERLDLSCYSANDARVFGFVSERLLDYWIESNGLAYAEMPVVNLENQHWLRKVAIFLRRKAVGSLGIGGK